MDLCQLMFPASYPEMKDCKSLLMVGAKGSCKTSLLLQIASSLSHQYCKSSDAEDCTIMFISAIQLTKLPFHVHRMPRFDAISARNISMQYMNTYGDLISHLANLFSHAGKISALVLDGIDLFLKTIDEKQDGNYKDCLTKLLALLVDLGGHYSACEDASMTGEPCPVVAAFDSNAEDINEKMLVSSLADQFFENTLQIEPCTILGSQNGFRMVDISDTRIYYYLDEEEIHLHRIAKIIKQFD